jgi:hypothetical protein
MVSGFGDEYRYGGGSAQFNRLALNGCRRYCWVLLFDSECPFP